jgi:hypothetical protein
MSIQRQVFDRQPEIRSGEAAVPAIDRWLAFIDKYDFPALRCNNPTNRRLGVEQRRRVMRALGEFAREKGHIKIHPGIDAISRRSGVRRGKVARHLQQEAADGFLLRQMKPGEKGKPKPQGHRHAAVYKLHVDRPEIAKSAGLIGDFDGDFDGVTTTTDNIGRRFPAPSFSHGEEKPSIGQPAFTAAGPAPDVREPSSSQATDIDASEAFRAGGTPIRDAESPDEPCVVCEADLEPHPWSRGRSQHITFACQNWGRPDHSDVKSMIVRYSDGSGSAIAPWRCLDCGAPFLDWSLGKGHDCEALDDCA